MKMSPRKEELENAYTRCRNGIHSTADRDQIWVETTIRLNNRARGRKYKTLFDDPEGSVSDLLERVFKQLDSSEDETEKTFWKQHDFERFLAYLTTALKNDGISARGKIRRFFSLNNLGRSSADETRESFDVEEPQSRGILTRVGDEERSHDLRQVLHRMVEDDIITADERDICIRRKVDGWSREKIREEFGLRRNRDVSDTWTRVHPLMKKFIADGLHLSTGGRTR